MYFCRLGIICTLLSDALVNAFICGAGFHIFTSQIKEVFGVKPARYAGPLNLIYVSFFFIFFYGFCLKHINNFFFINILLFILI
jgi:MFS superfamily sulfate permease-like transporter